MNITPSTNLKLLKNPLHLDYKHQLTFQNKQAQFNYFNNLSKLEVEEISYQRHNSTLDFEKHIDELLEYNYCMYQNSNYGNKWFYAFISNMEYLNDYNTRITLELDVFQTWQFDLDFKKSFVEREMINVLEDVPGNNLQPENLETGEYINNLLEYYDGLDDYVYIMQVTKMEQDPQISATNFGGIPMAGGAYIFENFSDLSTLIDAYASTEGLTVDAIYNVYMLPKNFIRMPDSGSRYPRSISSDF